MKMKIKSPETPVATFKVDRTKLIPCYIPEFEGEFFAIHGIFAMLMSNIDFDNGNIYSTRQIAEELSLLNGNEIEYARQYMETHINEYLYRASVMGLFDYEYLGDDENDYGHYIRFSKMPVFLKEIYNA